MGRVTNVTARDRDFSAYKAHRTGHVPPIYNRRVRSPLACVSMNRKNAPWLILAAVAALTFLACSGGGTVTSNPGTPPPPPTSVAAGDVTLAEFNQLKQGMTYEQVTELVGSQGQLVSQSGPMSMYSYPGNSPLGRATFTFQDGKLTAFTQVGLR